LACQFVEENDLVGRSVAGKLPEEEAEAVEAHYFGCERCWSEVRAATEVRAAMEKPAGAPVVPLAERREERRRRAVFSGRALALAATLLIAAVAGVFVWRTRVGSGGSGFEALARATEGRRTIDARLSGPFAYADKTEPTRSEDDPNAPSSELTDTARVARARAREDPTAENLHAAGVGRLLIDQWDAAIEELERAKSKAPRDARILSDLAAAYHARSRSLERPTDLRPALEAAKEATEVDPTLPSARYNLALILQDLNLRQDAREAWDEYKRLDADPKWAKEVEEHLKKLNRPTEGELWPTKRERLKTEALAGQQDKVTGIVRQFPQQARQWGEDELLAQWADPSTPAIDHAAALRTAHSVAAALDEISGERLLLHSVQRVESLGARDAASERMRRGLQSFGRARLLYRAADIAAADIEFESARRILGESGSPLALLAELGIASCRYYRLDPLETEKALDAIDGRFDAKEYPSLQARLLWMRGLVASTRGHPEDSLGYLGAALAIAERLGEKEDVSNLRTLLGAVAEVAGDYDAAWRHHVAALSALDPFAPPSRIQTALAELGQNAAAAGFPRLSELVHARQVANADASKIPLFQAQARVWLARSRPASQSDAAESDLEAARRYAEQVTDEGVRRRLEGELALTSAEVIGRIDVERAGSFLDTAERFFRESGDLERLTEVGIARARLEYAAGREDAALTALLAVVDAKQANVSNVSDRKLRSGYLGMAADAFQNAIDLADRLGNSRLALRLTEQARAAADRGAFLDDGSPEALSSLQRGLPSGSAVLSFWVLTDRTLGWLVTPQSFESRSLAITRSEAAELVDGLRAKIQKRDPTAASSFEARRLHSTLLGPFEADLRDTNALVIVSHGALAGLPFAVLAEASSSEPLVQRFTLSLSPRVFAAHPSSKAAPIGASSPALLVLGERSPGPGALPALPEARKELEAIALLLPRSTILAGSQFSAERTKGIPILHFALHAAGHKEAPYLALTGDHALGIAAMEKLPLDQTSLVVLSACATATGPTQALGNQVTLSEAALTAGAHVVIASLWPIDDESAKRFSEAYYKALIDWGDPILSLQKTQYSFMKSAQPPNEWAAFVAHGRS
jgi:CHAT domain-containing protein